MAEWLEMHLPEKVTLRYAGLRGSWPHRKGVGPPHKPLGLANCVVLQLALPRCMGELEAGAAPEAVEHWGQDRTARHLPERHVHLRQLFMSGAVLGPARAMGSISVTESGLARSCAN